jgi:hypothetical protein
MRWVLDGRSKNFQVGLNGGHEDHVVEDDDVVSLLADFHTVDQLLVGSGTQPQNLLTH